MSSPNVLRSQRVLRRRVTARADQPGRTGGDGVAALIQGEHRDLEAFAGLAEQVALGHFHLVHLEVARVAGEDAPLLLQRAAGKALEPALDDEGGNARDVALLLLLEIGPREDEKVVGDVGQRDPHLLARQHVPVAGLDRHRLNAAHVAARGRFGESVGGDLPALGLRDQITLLLILGSPGEQGEAVQAGMHRHDHAQRGVDVFEFLARQSE